MNDCCAPKKGNGRAYDLAIIGAGSAGFSAAITAARQGARVALIGGGTIGGTCVNVGCVPSKTLIRAAETLHDASTARRFSGISASARIDDWGAVARQKDDLVASLRQAKYVDLLPAYNNIAYLEGKACLQESAARWLAASPSRPPKSSSRPGRGPPFQTFWASKACPISPAPQPSN
jgi:mercuric reductase